MRGKKKKKKKKQRKKEKRPRKKKENLPSIKRKVRPQERGREQRGW